jgi:hypothetical protein
MLLEEEQATATDLEKKATATKGLLPSSSFSTMFDMVDGVAYNSSPTSTFMPQRCQMFTNW